MDQLQNLITTARSQRYRAIQILYKRLCFQFRAAISLKIDAGTTLYVLVLIGCGGCARLSTVDLGSAKFEPL